MSMMGDSPGGATAARRGLESSVSFPTAEATLSYRHSPYGRGFMDRSVRRLVVTVLLFGIVTGLFLIYALSGQRAVPPAPGPDETAAEEVLTDAPDSDRSAGPPPVPGDVDHGPAEDDAVVDLDDIDPDQPRLSIDELRARPAHVEGIDPDAEPTSLGSLNPNEAPLLVEFSRNGAGIKRITSSRHWYTVLARKQAEAHYAALAAGDAEIPPLPGEELRYVLKKERPLEGVMIPILATNRIEVTPGGAGEEERRLVTLWNWAETAPGRFEIVVVNADEEPALRVIRQYGLGENGGITLQQRVQNLSGRPLDVRWLQYGPGDMEVERTRYLDRRRFRFGYLLSPERNPHRHLVFADDRSLILERRDVAKREGGDRTLWPNRTSETEGYELSWFGSTNRYFAVVIHPLLDEEGRGRKSLTPVVQRIEMEHSAGGAEGDSIFTYLYSPVHTVDAGHTLLLDVGLYAGPMERATLANVEPFKSLAMDGLVVYMMSTWCAICTFQWLAAFLLIILEFFHGYIFFDWALAIIGLVIVVRLILHPITKKSQVNMMRFGKQMQSMKPEMERIQKKYKDDKKKQQEETLRLYREHGVNPFQMLGCLPMFLQIPIWIALYAMLYFAYELRQEPAFFGIFQMIGGWPFLADLSTGDHFFGQFADPILLFGFWNITGLNVLPILMAVMLYIHQKYMTPPPSPSMSDEQIQQQRIMRIMIVGMMPIFLFNAPSGLTLYILTSSAIGIVESKYIRAHVDKMDLEPKVTQPVSPAGKKKKKPKDPQARAYAEAMERAKKERSRKSSKPRSFKKRRDG